ncbi:MAG: cytochrome c3 family protein [Deltaproteobacteria bacterium]|nr:cytochrome c3 family protein [Deltaproteobacteria bacterium]
MKATTSRWVWILLAFAIGVALPARADNPAPRLPRPPGASGDSGPSRAIFPAQTIPLRFNHASHIAMGQTCLHCHPGAATSQQTSDRLLPRPQICDRCHGSRHVDIGTVQAGPEAKGACIFCHVSYEASQPQVVQRVVMPEPVIRLNHLAHARRNIGCGQCHGAVQELGLATSDQMPRMRGCYRCHDLPAESRGAAPAGCPTCHLTLPGGRLQTHLPSGVLRPPRWLGNAKHDGDFVHRHKRVAGDNSRLCASCHTEDDCTSCHDGRLRPRGIHPNDFLSMHPVAARQNSPRCSSCHQAQSFCKTCHQRAGVTMSGSPYARREQGRFHPPSEVFTSGTRTPRHHAWEAQRNLSACVSCHSERDCASCHASRGGGGLGVNPHPAGFLSRCATAFRRNPRPCLVCHDPSEQVLASCR